MLDDENEWIHLHVTKEIQSIPTYTENSEAKTKESKFPD